MNIHKKLIDLGFKKIDPHKLEFDSQVGKKFIKYKDLKLDVPKWTFTYYFEFSKSVKVWSIVQKHTIISIYVESENIDKNKTLTIKNRTYYGDHIKLVFSNVGGQSLESIDNIIQFLPKEVKRDLIISKLFK